MKNRTDRVLLATLLVTAALYGVTLLIWLEIVPLPFAVPSRLSSLLACLTFGFHGVPCFCLQLLVCRRTKRTGLRLLPAVLLMGIGVWFAVGCFTSEGWDAVGWFLLLLLCAAPAAGIALAWLIYGLNKLRKRRQL